MRAAGLQGSADAVAAEGDLGAGDLRAAQEEGGVAVCTTKHPLSAPHCCTNLAESDKVLQSFAAILLGRKTSWQLHPGLFASDK